MFYFVYSSPIDTTFFITKSTACFCKKVQPDKFIYTSFVSSVMYNASQYLCNFKAENSAVCNLLIYLEFVIHSIWKSGISFGFFFFGFVLFCFVCLFFFLAATFQAFHSFIALYYPHYRFNIIPIRNAILLVSYVYIHNNILRNNVLWLTFVFSFDGFPILKLFAIERKKLPKLVKIVENKVF